MYVCSIHFTMSEQYICSFIYSTVFIHLFYSIHSSILQYSFIYSTVFIHLFYSIHSSILQYSFFYSTVFIHLFYSIHSSILIHLFYSIHSSILQYSFFIPFLRRWLLYYQEKRKGVGNFIQDNTEV